MPKRSYNQAYGRLKPLKRKRSFTSNSMPVTIVSKKQKVSEAVKTYVNRSIARNKGLKTSVQYAVNGNVTIASSATGPATSVLFAGISQGAGENQRIGNKIKVVGGKARYYINLKPPNISTNTAPFPIHVRMLLVTNKISNNTSGFGLSTFANFFENGSSSSTFQANMLDMIMPVNNEVWTVHDERTFKLGVSGTGSGSVGVPSNSNFEGDAKFSQKVEFDFPKRILQFDDTGALTNYNLLLVIQAVSANGDDGSLQQPIEYHVATELLFVDA